MLQQRTTTSMTLLWCSPGSLLLRAHRKQTTLRPRSAFAGDTSLHKPPATLSAAVPEGRVRAPAPAPRSRVPAPSSLLRSGRWRPQEGRAGRAAAFAAAATRSVCEAAAPQQQKHVPVGGGPRRLGRASGCPSSKNCRGRRRNSPLSLELPEAMRHAPALGMTARRVRQGCHRFSCFNPASVSLP